MNGRKLSDIKFDALRNAIYHSARRSFLDTLNRCLSFIVVAAGTTAVGDLGAKIGFGSVQFYAAVAALAGALQLVFDFGVRARTHEFLQRRYYELSALVSEVAEPSEKVIAHWDSELQRLYSEEPTPMRALDAIAYNVACESLGYSHDKRVEVRWYHSLLRQLYPFHQSEFPWVGKGKAAKLF
jgi:hypothetical protein